MWLNIIQKTVNKFWHNKKKTKDGNVKLKQRRVILPHQFSHSVVSNSLWLHEPQHTRPPCPSPTPGVQPNPCPSSWWCHPTISSSVVHFSCPQSFPASGSFPMDWLFASSGQGASASATILPTVVFWKHTSCLVPWLPSWGEFASVNPTLSPTHIWFQWYSDETLDFRVLIWCWKELRLWGLLGWNECILQVRKTWMWGAPWAECNALNVLSALPPIHRSKF